MNDREREVVEWAKARIDARDFVVLDTETTGTDVDARVVSIALVNAWGKLCFSSLVKPTAPIDESGKAFEINGISNEMVKDAPPFDDVWDMAVKHIHGRRIIAYNDVFDFGMVRRSIQLSRNTPFRQSWACAMLAYAKYSGELGPYGDYRWHRLENACAQMGLTASGYHDAASDALATYRLVKALSEVEPPVSAPNGVQ